jgi:hypothetical protein
MQEIEIDEYGTKRYYWNGQLHRADGPAQEWPTHRYKAWYLYGKFHREDGPARECVDGKEWYYHGKLHREDGPAIEYTNGNKEWYLQGTEYTEEEYGRLVKLKALW